MNSLYKLTISEPWDFKANDSNVIFGSVLKKIDSQNLLFQSREDVSIGGISGRLFILSTRYSDETFGRDPFSAIVNGGFVSIDEYESLSSKEIKDRSTFAFIGSLSVNDSQSE